jgi:anti-anti-sigma factor
VEISEKKENEIVVIGLNGRLDAATSFDFETKIIGLIDSGERKLVVDFSQMDYISSSGLRVLLMAAKKLKEVNGRIIIASASSHIQNVFNIAGFTSIFSMTASVKEAMEILK